MFYIKQKTDLDASCDDQNTHNTINACMCSDKRLCAMQQTHSSRVAQQSVRADPPLPQVQLPSHNCRTHQRCRCTNYRNHHHQPRAVSCCKRARLTTACRKSEASGSDKNSTTPPTTKQATGRRAACSLSEPCVGTCPWPPPLTHAPGGKTQQSTITRTQHDGASIVCD